MTQHKVYDDIIELLNAIEERKIVREMVTPVINGGELYIQTSTGFTLFTRDYGSESGCEDVARLLGFEFDEIDRQ